MGGGVLAGQSQSPERQSMYQHQEKHCGLQSCCVHMPANRETGIQEPTVSELCCWRVSTIHINVYLYMYVYTHVYVCDLLLLGQGKEHVMAISAVLLYLCLPDQCGQTCKCHVCMCSMGLCLPAMYFQPYYWSYLWVWSCNSLKMLDPAQYSSCNNSSQK